MDHKENNAGLGKNHDQAAHQHDIAKKQSEAKPAAENLEMMPNSVNKDGSKEFSSSKTEDPIKIKAEDYAQQEHDKADNWEHKPKER